jgi:hypothetical protein
MLGPYYVQPNLTGLTKTSASSWIFDLEFFKKYFCDSQTHRKHDLPAHF